MTLIALSGNNVLADILENLLARTSIAVALHHRQHHPDCLFEEHVALADAIERGDSAAAARTMRDHLNHVAETFSSVAPEVASLDFSEIFEKQRE
jgi:DNA-binding GntR family transcriptional regulator